MITTLETIEARLHAENAATEMCPMLSWKFMTDSQLYDALGYLHVPAAQSEDQIAEIQSFRRLYEANAYTPCSHGK